MSSSRSDWRAVPDFSIPISAVLCPSPRRTSRHPCRRTLYCHDSGDQRHPWGSRSRIGPMAAGRPPGRSINDRPAGVLAHPANSSKRSLPAAGADASPVTPVPVTPPAGILQRGCDRSSSILFQSGLRVASGFTPGMAHGPNNRVATVILGPRGRGARGDRVRTKAARRGCERTIPNR